MPLRVLQPAQTGSATSTGGMRVLQPSSSPVDQMTSPYDNPQIRAFLEQRTMASMSPITGGMNMMGELLGRGYKASEENYNAQPPQSMGETALNAALPIIPIAKNAIEGVSNVGKGLWGLGEGFVKATGALLQGDMNTVNEESKKAMGGLSQAAGGAVQTIVSPFSGVIEAAPVPHQVKSAVNALFSLPTEAGKELFTETMKVIKPDLDTESPEWKKNLDMVGNALNLLLVSQGLSKGKQITTKASEVAGEFGKIPEKIGEGMAENTVKNRVNDLTKIQENNSAVRKVIEAAESRGIDVKGMLAKTDLLKGVVDKDGTIKTAPAIEELNTFLKQPEGVVGKSLAKEGKTVPLASIQAALEAAVKDTGVEGAALIRGLKQVKDEIAGYKLKANEKGEVPLSTLQDAKIDKYSNINYLDKEKGKIDKGIGLGLKEFIEKTTESVDVKALNKELAGYYAMRDLLKKLDSKKVKGGRLGKYVMTGIGGLVGHSFGPLGAIVGAELGRLLQGQSMANTFKGTAGGELNLSPGMKTVIESNKTPNLQSPTGIQPPAGFNPAGTAESAIPKGTSIESPSAKQFSTYEKKAPELNFTNPDSMKLIREKKSGEIVGVKRRGDGVKML